MYFEDIAKRRATHRQLPYNKIRPGQPLLGAHVFDDGLRRFFGFCIGLMATVGDVIVKLQMRPKRVRAAARNKGRTSWLPMV